MTLAVIVHRNGFAPTQTGHGNASLDLTRAREEAAGGTGTDPSGATRTAERATSSGPAVLRANGAEHQLTQTSVAGNVVVKVLLFETKTSGVDAGARADELMATLAATTEAIAAEVVAQLIPQPA